MIPGILPWSAGGFVYPQRADLACLVWYIYVEMGCICIAQLPSAWSHRKCAVLTSLPQGPLDRRHMTWEARAPQLQQW